MNWPVKLSRDQIIEAVQDGFLNKKMIFHFDVCQALAEGKTQQKIAEGHDIRDFKTIRNIVKRKCKYCDVG